MRVLIPEPMASGVQLDGVSPSQLLKAIMEVTTKMNSLKANPILTLMAPADIYIAKFLLSLGFYNLVNDWFISKGRNIKDYSDLSEYFEG